MYRVVALRYALLMMIRMMMVVMVRNGREVARVATATADTSVGVAVAGGLCCGRR
jgi:hypothetical protein